MVCAPLSSPWASSSQPRVAGGAPTTQARRTHVSGWRRGPHGCLRVQRAGALSARAVSADCNGHASCRRCVARRDGQRRPRKDLLWQRHRTRSGVDSVTSCVATSASSPLPWAGVARNCTRAFATRRWPSRSAPIAASAAASASTTRTARSWASRVTRIAPSVADDPRAYQALTRGAPGEARPTPQQQAARAGRVPAYQPHLVAPEVTGSLAYVQSAGRSSGRCDRPGGRVWRVEMECDKAGRVTGWRGMTGLLS